MSPPDVTIVGAGITGLAAAWELTGGAPEGSAELTVRVIEAEDRPGGKIGASDVDGLHLDEGADAFLVRTPEALDLCAEIGLTDLVEPSGLPAFVLIDDELRRFPGGLVLGAPARYDELERSAILTDAGLERARLEPTPALGPGDVSVGELITAHYGSEVTERLVGPLIGGISAGSVDRLSAAAVTPQLFAAGTGPLPMAAALREAPTSTDAVFAAPRAGMSTLIDTLVARLREAGVRFEWGRRVETVTTGSGGGWVVTTPAHVAAPMLGNVSPDAAALLSGIAFASVVFVTVAFDRDQVRSMPEGSGYLVPRSAGRRVTAASWMSSKWPHLDAGDRVIVRASLGHIDDDEPIGWDDATIVATVLAELRDTIGVQGDARSHRVVRYPRAFPHYDVGHVDRMERLSEILAADCPDVAVCGMAHHGVGIPACIRSGRSAAAGMRGRLTE